jgi:hypothetical protein
MRALREFIRSILVEAEAEACPASTDTACPAEIDQNPDPEKDDKDPPENLLTEPDIPTEDEDEQKEASVVGAAGAPSGMIRGSTSPLGTDPTYPTKKKKKKKGTTLSHGDGAAWYLPKKR